MATEREQIRHVVLGIGINVNQAAFPAELDGPGHLAAAWLSGRPHDRTRLLAALLDALEPAYDQALRDGGADGLARWRMLAALPRPCRISRPQGEAPVVGTAVDVDAEGALLFRDARRAAAAGAFGRADSPVVSRRPRRPPPMSFLHVLLLGLVQGVTEFLPISSTAHLRVVPALLGQPDPGRGADRGAAAGLAGRR